MVLKEKIGYKMYELISTSFSLFIDLLFNCWCLLGYDKVLLYRLTLIFINDTCVSN